MSVTLRTDTSSANLDSYSFINRKCVMKSTSELSFSIPARPIPEHIPPSDPPPDVITPNHEPTPEWPPRSDPPSKNPPLSDPEIPVPERLNNCIVILPCIYS